MTGILRQHVPAWVCWYGAATRRWWGMPPRAHWHLMLIDAATADELALRIRQMSATERRVTANRTNGHCGHDLA